MRSTSTPAHRAYYQSVEGRWRGRLRFAITDGARFWAAPLSWLDRLRAVAMALGS